MIIISSFRRKKGGRIIDKLLIKEKFIIVRFGQTIDISA